MLDLEPATRALSHVVTGLRDDQLDAPTPCSETTLGGLLDHVDGLAQAFTAAATKHGTDASNAGPSAGASRLGTDWRERIPQRSVDRPHGPASRLERERNMSGTPVSHA